MEQLRTYLLSVISAAMICWLVAALLPKTRAVASIGNLLCGVFMTITILSPVVSWRLPDIGSYVDGFESEAQEAAVFGKTLSANALESIIKQRCEAYILDKANDFGAKITVTISVSADALPIPSAAEVRGEWSPYAKLRLQEIMQRDLGIEKEAQIWKS